LHVAAAPYLSKGKGGRRNPCGCQFPPLRKTRARAAATVLPWGEVPNPLRKKEQQFYLWNGSEWFEAAPDEGVYTLTVHFTR
jgi:hypothetical protein